MDCPLETSNRLVEYTYEYNNTESLSASKLMLEQQKKYRIRIEF